MSKNVIFKHETKRVIRNEKATIVILNEKYKGVALLSKGDINFPEIGENIATIRALQKAVMDFTEKQIEEEILKGEKMKKESENFKIVKGDLLNDFKGDMISHQVNCRGIMGSGIAYQIKNMYPKLYDEYSEYCSNFNHILGDATFYRTSKYVIANLFGQDGFGRNGVATNYTALKSSLNHLKEYMDDNCLTSVGFPYMIGCGLAGGDEDVVMQIIKDIFSNTGIIVTFYDFN